MVVEGEWLAEGREAEVFVLPDGTVLKLMRDPGDADRVAREAAALRVLAAGGYPAPTLMGTTTVDGRPGLVTTRVHGTDMLSALERRPQSVFRAADAMGALHAAMHDRVAPADLPDLHDVVRDRVAAAGALDVVLRHRVLGLLASLPHGDRLCHYDLHLGNVLADPAAPVVIDWGDASRGAPVADVARTTVLHRFARLPPGAPTVARVLAPVGRRVIMARYRRAYGAAAGRVDEALLERWVLVVAAGRLSEPVPGDHAALLRHVRRNVDRLAPAGRTA